MSEEVTFIPCVDIESYVNERQEGKVTVIFDYESGVCCEVWLESGEPHFRVTEVHFDGDDEQIDGFSAPSDSLAYKLAQAVKEQVEKDPHYKELAVELSSLSLRGQGANDPDARWVWGS